VTDLFVALVVGLLEALVKSAGPTLHEALGTWLLSTQDMSQLTPRPITANPNLRALHHLILLMSDALLVLTLMWASGRSMWERSFRAKYTLKVVVPRILSAIALAHFSLLLGQMVIDLNNAMVAAVWNYRLPRGTTRFPWEAIGLSPGVFQAANLFTVLLWGALLIAVCILLLSYVIRLTVLAVLLVLAPLAALCLVLPETHTYARAWTRLFTTTVFTQFVQIVVLKLAAALMLDQHGSLIQAVYGLATVYVLLKIPGALHSSSQLGTRALRMASHAEHSLQKMVMHQLRPATTAA
jgi:hypothetical protein